MRILIDQVDHPFPQTFNEMSVEQIAVYTKEFILNRDAIFETTKEGKIVVKNEFLFSKALCKMLFYLLPVTWHNFVKMDESWKHYLLYEEKVLAFMSTDNLTELPCTKIKAGGTTYHAPKSAIILATEEFSYLDKTYQAYFKHQDKKFLNLFVATIFRETNFMQIFRAKMPTSNGDIRVPFNKHNLEARAKQMERVPFDTKLVIWFWYHCYRATLPKLHPAVFTKSNEEKVKDSDWLSVVLSLAADGPFGNYNDVCNTQVHLVLSELNRKAVNHKEMMKKHAK